MQVISRPGSRKIPGSQGPLRGQVNQGTPSRSKEKSGSTKRCLRSGRVLYHLDGAKFEKMQRQGMMIGCSKIHRIPALEESTILEVSTSGLEDVIRLKGYSGRG